MSIDEAQVSVQRADANLGAPKVLVSNTEVFRLRLAGASLMRAEEPGNQAALDMNSRAREM